jgi:phospholipid/cholesterol/gamma-HCH transport system permease protein
VKRRIENFLVEISEHLEFFVRLIKSLLHDRFEGREFLTQLAQISWRSLPTTITAGIFTGAVLAIQFYLQLKDFGAESALGGLSTSGTLREVGPILIAFMLAGKVGAFTSAELGTMKVTDQIDAIRCLGVDPIPFLIVPRFLAVAISGMLLLAFGLVISVVGGMLSASFVADINPAQYLSMIPRFTGLDSVALAVIKSAGFGVLMAHLCCKNGFESKGGTRGVGDAVRQTAVQSMVAIVLLDFGITWILTAILRAKENF